MVPAHKVSGVGSVAARVSCEWSHWEVSLTLLRHRSKIKLSVHVLFSQCLKKRTWLLVQKGNLPLIIFYQNGYSGEQVSTQQLTRHFKKNPPSSSIAAVKPQLCLWHLILTGLVSMKNAVHLLDVLSGTCPCTKINLQFLLMFSTKSRKQNKAYESCIYYSSLLCLASGQPPNQGNE